MAYPIFSLKVKEELQPVLVQLYVKELLKIH